MKILVCGLPGSGKTTLADRLAKDLYYTRLNADQVRSELNDWDFSEEGRKRQARRLRDITNRIPRSITDFVCPTKETRKIFKADYVIWMDTIDKSEYDDTNKMFERLRENEYDLQITNWENYEFILSAFRSYISRTDAV